MMDMNPHHEQDLTRSSRVTGTPESIFGKLKIRSTVSDRYGI
jgi:hypothetical protein